MQSSAAQCTCCRQYHGQHHALGLASRFLMHTCTQRTLAVAHVHRCVPSGNSILQQLNDIFPSKAQLRVQCAQLHHGSTCLLGHIHSGQESRGSCKSSPDVVKMQLLPSAATLSIRLALGQRGNGIKRFGGDENTSNNVNDVYIHPSCTALQEIR